MGEDEGTSGSEREKETKIGDDKEAVKPIMLNSKSSSNSNSKDIKSEKDTETLIRNLAIAGVVVFCIIFGALFLINSRKEKNEFR